MVSNLIRHTLPGIIMGRGWRPEDSDDRCPRYSLVNSAIPGSVYRFEESVV